MNRLFQTDLGEKLTSNATRLQLELLKGDDGIVCSYELSGCTGALDDDAHISASADMAFVADLIRAFRKGGTP